MQGVFFLASKKSSLTLFAPKPTNISSKLDPVQYMKLVPASPAIGDMVRIVDATGAAATNNITVGRASQNIQGAAADLTIGANRAGIGLVFYNATHGWVLTDN